MSKVALPSLLSYKTIKQKVNSKGQVVYNEYDSGYYEKIRYDKHGNIVYYKDNLYWEKQKYDKHGNKVWYKNNCGKQERYKQNKKGRYYAT